MGLFGKKSEKDKLHKKYEKLMKESYNLSKINRSASDEKQAEAAEVMRITHKIEWNNSDDW